MAPRIPPEVRGVAWIDADGFLDPGKFPIDSILRQALHPSFEQFRSGAVFPRSMIG